MHPTLPLGPPLSASVAPVTSVVWSGLPGAQRIPASGRGHALCAKPVEPQALPHFHVSCQFQAQELHTGLGAGGHVTGSVGLRAASLTEVSSHRLRGGGLVPGPGAAVQAGHPQCHSPQHYLPPPPA